jgi:hypothetical protein
MNIEKEIIDSVGRSVMDSVIDSVWSSVHGSVYSSVWNSALGSVYDSVDVPMWNTVSNTIREYEY